MNQKDNDKIVLDEKARTLITEQITRMLGPDTDPEAVRKAVEEGIKKLPSQAELAKMEQDLVKKYPGLAKFMTPRN